MSLNNVESSSNALVCTGTDGVAVSKATPHFATELPYQTAITTPNIITASEVWDNRFEAWRAFEEGTTPWMTHSNGGTLPKWIKIEYPSTQTITGFRITLPNHRRAPYNFTLDGSSDGSSWTTVETFTEEVFVDNGTNTYNLRPASYKYFRINVTTLVPDGEPILKISNIRFFGAGLSKPINFVPKMTHNNQPLGLAYADSEYGSSAFHAFDGAGHTAWVANPNALFPERIGYTLPKPKVVNVIKIKPRHEYIDEAPKDFTIVGHKGAQNDVLLSVTNQTYIDGEFSWFFLENTTVYEKYEINTSATESTNLSIAEIEMLHSTNDVISKVKNIAGKFEFKNISANSTANNLKTTELIKNGDNLVIVKDDNSVHEVVASGVTGTGPYTMDTTSITNGEVPSRVYRVDEAVEFNGNPFTKLMDTYFTTSTALKTYRTFTDKPITPSGSIVTKVKMSATGNKMTELTYDAIK